MRRPPKGKRIAGRQASAAIRPPRTPPPSAGTPSRAPPRGGSPTPPRVARGAGAAARLRGACAEHPGALEERPHRVGGRRPLGEPLRGLVLVHLEHGRVGARVVVTD